MGTNFTKLLSSLYIGNRGDLQGDYVGTVDEVGVWDRELSADEVRDLYDYGQNFDRCQAEQTDFHFRTYTPEFALFTQPDTLIQNVYDPQLLNRYAFERNNPYNNADKTGHGDYSPVLGRLSAAGTLVEGVYLYIRYTILIGRTDNAALKEYYLGQRSLIIPGYGNRAFAYLITGTPGQGKTAIIPGFAAPNIAPFSNYNYYEEPPSIEQFYKDAALLSSTASLAAINGQTQSIQQCIAQSGTSAPIFSPSNLNQDQYSYWPSVETVPIIGSGGGGGGSGFWTDVEQIAQQNPNATAAEIIQKARQLSGE